MILHQVQGGLLALPVDAQLGPGAVVHKLSVLGQNGGEGIIQTLQHTVAAGEGELTFRSYAAFAFGYRGEGGELIRIEFLQFLVIDNRTAAVSNVNLTTATVLFRIDIDSSAPVCLSYDYAIVRSLCRRTL